jgi:hypothetical protein
MHCGHDLGLSSTWQTELPGESVFPPLTSNNNWKIRVWSREQPPKAFVSIRSLPSSKLRSLMDRTSKTALTLILQTVEGLRIYMLVNQSKVILYQGNSKRIANWAIGPEPVIFITESRELNFAIREMWCGRQCHRWQSGTSHEEKKTGLKLEKERWRIAK